MDRRRLLAVVGVSAMGWIASPLWRRMQRSRGETNMECIILDGEEVCLGPAPVATEPAGKPKKKRG